MPTNSRRLARNPLDLVGTPSTPSLNSVPPAAPLELEAQTQKPVPVEVSEKSKNLEFQKQESRFFTLAVRILEELNDELDEAVKVTRRATGTKIPKEVIVVAAIRSALKQVQQAGGWQKISTAEALYKLLDLD